MPRSSYFLRNSIIHFSMFLYLVTCFLRVTVSLCHLEAASKILVSNLKLSLSNYIHAVNRYEIVRSCNRHSNETVTLRKHVTKYKNMQKLIVEFFRKFENGGIKIDGVNSILITKSVDFQLFTLILYCVGGPL